MVLTMEETEEEGWNVTNEEEETDKEAGRWRRNGTHDSFDVLR